MQITGWLPLVIIVSISLMLNHISPQKLLALFFPYPPQQSSSTTKILFLVQYSDLLEPNDIANPSVARTSATI